MFDVQMLQFNEHYIHVEELLKKYPTLQEIQISLVSHYLQLLSEHLTHYFYSSLFPLIKA